jgi:hypothetical protein
VRRSFDAAMLVRFRAMPSEKALPLVAIDLKADKNFFPVKDSTSRRGHARTACGEFEILTAGSNGMTRAQSGVVGEPLISSCICVHCHLSIPSST